MPAKITKSVTKPNRNSQTTKLNVIQDTINEFKNEESEPI
jgi:hypothetical protein